MTLYQNFYFRTNFTDTFEIIIGAETQGLLFVHNSPIQRKLERQPGGDRQMVDILGAILTDGLEAVEAACSEALSHNVHSAGVVLNILARHREPPPPLTITTPEALRLN